MEIREHETASEGDLGDRELRPSDDGLVSGLIRRVRRMAELSQRELAQELGVSQSAVAKWETGRTSPAATMLARVLAVAELSLAAVRGGGDRRRVEHPSAEHQGFDERVHPMNVVAARDAADRRYPAHAFVWAEGWWAPEGSAMTAWYGQILSRSADLDLPRVRHSRQRPWDRPPSVVVVDDHPTWPELVAQARQGWRPPLLPAFTIPEWVLADTRRSRNRRPEKFREPARTVSLIRSGGGGQPRASTPRRE